jgi:hypothetical protein
MISVLCLSMVSAQTLRVCREGKPISTFPDRARTGIRSPNLREIAGNAVPQRFLSRQILVLARDVGEGRRTSQADHRGARYQRCCTEQSNERNLMLRHTKQAKVIE